MYFIKVLAVFLCSFVVAKGAFVDTLTKCPMEDGECHKKLIQNIIIDISQTGVPEMNIPPTDPVELKNVKASIPDIIDIILVEGVVKGVRKCTVNAFSPNIDKSVAHIDLTCDLVLKGKYKLSSSSPVIKTLLGGEEVHGEGNGKVKIEKLNIKLDIPYDLVIRDGDVYIHGKKKKISYTFDVLGRVTFAADNLYLGNEESSQRIVALLNDNWKTLVSTFGKNFIDVAIDFVFNFIQNILDNVSTKYYIIEDLHSRAKPK